MKTLQRSIIFLFSITFFSCNHTDTFPPQVAKAIDYFYIENKNDSVLASLDELPKQHLTARTKSIADIIVAGALCENGEVQTAENLLQQVEINLYDDEVKCLYNSMMGLILFRKEKLTESYQYLISTLSCKKIDKRTLALNERIIARILFTMSDTQQAVEYLLLSNKHFKEENLDKSIAVNQKILGRYYIQSKNYSQAINCFKLAENTFRKYNDQAELFYIYINFIDYYIHVNNFDKATYFTKLCATLCQNKQDLQMRSLLSNNLGEIAVKQKKYEEAILYYTATLNLPAGFSYENIRRLNANINLSYVYNLKNDYKMSQFYAQEAKKLRKSDNETFTQYKLYRRLAESFLSNQSKTTSYAYLDTATFWLDSAYRSASQTSKAFYDSKADLMTAGFKIQEMEQHAKRTKTIYIFLAVLITISAVSFTVIYRLQKTKNRALQQLVNKNLQVIDEERKLRLLLTKQYADAKKSNRKPTDSEKTEHLFNSLIDWLEDDKKYRRKDLTLDGVAKELNSNRDYLSRSINDKGIRFTDLINKYRVQEAIQIISDTSNIKSRYNLSIIASEVGFNSDSVFIDAFKKQIGMTPNQFRENINSSVK